MADPVISNIQINQQALHDFLQHEPEVARQFLNWGEKAKQSTLQSMVPTNGGSSGDFFPKRFFSEQLKARIVMAEDGPHCLVGAERTKTAAHEIYGKPLLVFQMPKGSGNVVYVNSSQGAHVNHPGSDLSSYLQTKLKGAIEMLRGAI